MDVVDPKINDYLLSLARSDDDEVLLEMEAEAEKEDFPIIGRLCGKSLEVIARAAGARRIFELGSGFGYSAYWFSRATGPEGEIHLSDGDPENERKAMDYLARAGLAEPITYHVGDALEALASVEGEFDIVYCDIDKDGYPDAWRASKERVRVGGLFMCDNMFFNGRAIDPDQDDAYGTAVNELNHAIAGDRDWRSFINPTRDGVIVAVRLR
jgi:predicted O-methyltransferase YrrM